MRCGPAPPVSLKLNFPLLSALVLAAISIPVVRLMRMTSSPEAGLLVVPLVTVPERVWAAAEARVSERMAASNAEWASLAKSIPFSGKQKNILQMHAKLRPRQSYHLTRTLAKDFANDSGNLF